MNNELSAANARIAELEGALRELLPWAGIHDEGCSLDPEFGKGHRCNCGLQTDRNRAHKALGNAHE